jgi:membrane protease YdiL (CAAX protease family)
MSLAPISSVNPTAPEPALPDPSVGEPPYPIYRQVWESTAVLLGVSLIVLAVPLGTPGYLVLSVSTSVVIPLYVAHGLWSVPGAARRWGLVGNPWRAEGIARGIYWAVAMITLGALPVIVGRELVDKPPMVARSVYFLWCLVQGFVFFSLLLRNLLDHIPQWAAIPLVAMVFGLSHYPFGALIAVTAAAAFVWGYIFSVSRSLWLVYVPHWLLGYLLMS